MINLIKCGYKQSYIYNIFPAIFFLIIFIIELKFLFIIVIILMYRLFSFNITNYTRIYIMK